MSMEPLGSYRQWMEHLLYLQEHPGDKAALQLLASGNFREPVPENLKVKISQTVSTLLTHRFRSFLREFDRALSEGELDMVPTFVTRFRTGVLGCLFYRQLTFLDAAFVRELDEGYAGQIRAFWKDFLKHLKQSARDSRNPDLDDLFRSLSRKELI